MAEKIPNLVWAQRQKKVFVSWQMVDTSDVTVTLSDGLLSLTGSAKGVSYKLENLPLWSEIDADDSSWFKNDRCLRPPDCPLLHIARAHGHDESCRRSVNECCCLACHAEQSQSA